MRISKTHVQLFTAAAMAVCAVGAGAERPVQVMPVLETEPVKSQGDAADDPAIWRHPEDPALSLILGTDKLKGLDVYGLDGKRRQHLATGHLNNVDVRQQVRWGAVTADIAVATNRSKHSIDVFFIDPESRSVTHSEADRIPLSLRNPYGICLFHDPKDESIYAFVNAKNGYVHQVLLAPNGQSKLVRKFKMQSQPEGCVVDDRNRVIFLAEESLGVWKASAGPATPYKPQLIAKVGSGLRADVEGLALIESESGSYLIVSSQGNSSFMVYAGTGIHERVGWFRSVLAADRTVDGANQTDGVAAMAGNFGERFPNGLVVVQDSRNTHPYSTQNFKLVSWRDIEIALNLLPWLNCGENSYSAGCQE